MTTPDGPEPYCDIIDRQKFDLLDKEVDCPKCSKKGTLRQYRGGSTAVVHGLVEKKVDGVSMIEYDSLCFLSEEQDVEVEEV